MKRLSFLAAPVVAFCVALTPGAGRAVEVKPTIGVGGFFNMVGGFTLDEDKGALNGGVDRPAFDINPSAEIFFDGRAELDNGISLRAHIELEANTDSDQIDESYVVIKGGFGQITLGSENGAAEMMTAGYGGSSVGVGTHYYIDGTNFLAPEGWAMPTSTTGVAHFWSDGDDEKITYYSPRILGFQIGVSFIPVFDGDDVMSGNASENYHDGYSLGVNFDRKISGVGIGMGAGLLTKGKPNMAALEHSDWAEYGLSARVDFRGIRLAAGFRAVLDGVISTYSHEGRIIDVGIRYTMGPNAVSVVFVDGDADGSTSNPASNRAQYLTVSVARALGPGVKGHLNVTQADWVGESPTSSDDNAGWAFLAGFNIGF